MEAGSHSGIARLVQQSLGTGALFPSYVFVTTFTLLSAIYTAVAVVLATSDATTQSPKQTSSRAIEVSLQLCHFLPGK
jgi:hypothetical protein